MKCVILICLLCALSGLAYAIDSNPPFSDPALQQRYEGLIHQFRCLVCQDESIANSNAGFAADLRRRVHKLVGEGKTDAEVKHYLVARYGDFVLYKPPLQANTLVLWAGPAIFLIVAGLTIGIAVRRQTRISRSEPETVAGEGAADLEWDREG